MWIGIAMYLFIGANSYVQSLVINMLIRHCSLFCWCVPCWPAGFFGGERRPGGDVWEEPGGGAETTPHAGKVAGVCHLLLHTGWPHFVFYLKYLRQLQPALHGRYRFSMVWFGLAKVGMAELQYAWLKCQINAQKCCALVTNSDTKSPGQSRVKCRIRCTHHWLEWWTNLLIWPQHHWFNMSVYPYRRSTSVFPIKY